MANQIFANKREVACKAGGGKTICAMPDVCMTPPETPATPPGIPVPYPNTGFASDTTDGSKTVHISGKEVMLKNKSFFKTSTGDEAGCATKKGVISSTNKGKVYFVAWSMNVKIEGENVVRHLDMTTNNHGSPTANESIPWPFIETVYDSDGVAIKDACTNDKQREKDACKGYKSKDNPTGKDVCGEGGLGSSYSKHKGATTTRSINASEDKCAAARRCRLTKFNAKRDGIEGCCPAQTPDHLIPKSSFYARNTKGNKLAGWSGYEPNDAPCMCSEGGNNTGTHGLRHACHKSTAAPIKPGMRRGFMDEMKHCVASVKQVAPHCSPECLEAQLIRGHEEMGDLTKEVKFSPCGKPDTSRFSELIARIEAASKRFPKNVK